MVLKFLFEALAALLAGTKLRASSMHNVEASIDAFGTVRCTSCNTHFNITSSPSGLHGFKQNRIFDPLGIFDAQAMIR